VDGEFWLTKNNLDADPILRLVLAIFDYKPGQQLNLYSGLNEFISALVMAKMLGDILPAKELLKATVCIEATIPFRTPDAHGRRHLEVLEERLVSIRPWCGFKCSIGDIESALKRAVLFSNKDVETFAEASVSRFLDITWKLLPEMNSALRSRGIYTIRDYRIAIQKMEFFLSGLNPELIFNDYKNTPPPDLYERMRQQARHNIGVAIRYLRIKLVAMGILEGIAEYSGGDAPISLFIGDIPNTGETARRLDDILPEIPIPAHIIPEEDEVYQLLKIGRESETFFDLKNSPLSLFVYISLSPDEIDSVYQDALLLFKSVLNPTGFLARVPRPLLSSIVRGCAVMAYTRRESLLQLVAEH
jgi:hypothetical protein